MTIDLKWTLPFAMPVVLVLLTKVLHFIMGAEFPDDAVGPTVFFSLLAGVPSGLVAMEALHVAGIKLNVSILEKTK